MDVRYEYGIWSNRDNVLHRDGMSEPGADDWVDEWLDNGGKPGVFRVVRRAVGPWENA